MYIILKYGKSLVFVVFLLIFFYLFYMSHAASFPELWGLAVILMALPSRPHGWSAAVLCVSPLMSQLPWHHLSSAYRRELRFEKGVFLFGKNKKLFSSSKLMILARNFTLRLFFRHSYFCFSQNAWIFYLLFSHIFDFLSFFVFC